MIMGKTSLRVLFTFSTAFFFIASLILNQAVHAKEILKVGGAGSALGSMKLLAAAFEKKHPGLKVEVLSSLGSLGGIKAVSKEAVDIGLMGRQLSDEERKLALSVTEYAKTPLVFVVKNDIPVTNMTIKELVSIFSGELRAWPNGNRIHPILRQPSESNAIIVRQISPEIGKAMDVAMSREWRIVALTDQETADMIDKTPGGFGFCTLTQIISEKRDLKILSYNNASPNSKNLANPSYPLFKTHSMVTKRNPSLPAKEFIRFVKSPEGKKILEASGNLALKDN
jgi:phosphate transport system substrate-binding protein